jgi:hypothetical protein
MHENASTNQYYLDDLEKFTHLEKVRPSHSHTPIHFPSPASPESRRAFISAEIFFFGSSPQSMM